MTGNPDDIRFRYFKSVVGHAVPRFGTTAWIGVRPDPEEGWVWDTDDVTRIPADEVVKNLRAYNRVLQTGGLIEVTEQDFDERQEEIEPPPTPAKPKKRKKKRTQTSADEEG